MRANLLTTTAALAVGAVQIVSPAPVNAQTPVCASPGCNPVVSDNYDSNTAMGTGALQNANLNTTYSELFNMFAIANTAAGYQALNNNENGWYNSAFGYEALAMNLGAQNNTALGYRALTNTGVNNDNLYHFSTGNNNTGVGGSALYTNTNGNSNSAVGYNTLTGNTTGSNNAALGAGALGSNTTANGNTAVGYNALTSNTTAANNAAFGYEALQSNVTGTQNIASGAESLFSNTSGDYNSAYGVQTLYFSTTASNNTASGYRALYRSTTGTDNTATGFAALLNNTTGSGNTGVGYNALNANTTGRDNIAIGNSAGYSVTGSNNIDIGSTGSAGESGVIRIGGSSQSAVYVAGITSTHLTGAAVYVDSKGQLGVLASSERYKTGVTTLSDAPERLRQLRPVSYHLKNDPNGDVQYGLIAEEVDRVLPELVIRDESGKIQGVRYDELAPLLLQEVQHQHDQLQNQESRLAAQASAITDLKRQLSKLRSLTETMQTALADGQRGTTAVGNHSGSNRPDATVGAATGMPR